jgi:hypothetical protein
MVWRGRRSRLPLNPRALGTAGYRSKADGRPRAPGRFALIESRPEVPALPTAAISVKAAATEKQDKNDDDQNG